MSTVLLGVTGCVSAYRAADIAHELTRAGHRVDVVLTRGATEFITPLTFHAITGRQVYTDLFDAGSSPSSHLHHLDLVRRADALVVAPASANTIAKLALGLADDLLTTCALALWNVPRFVAAAMNVAMHENPVVQENLAKLVEQGWEEIPPSVGHLAVGGVGLAAMAEVPRIVETVDSRLAPEPAHGSDINPFNDPFLG